MQKSRISILFEGYIANKLTGEEVLELQELLNGEEDQLDIRDLIGEELKRDPLLLSEEEWLAGIEVNIMNKLTGRRENVKPRVWRLWVRSAVAAILILGIGISLHYWLAKDNTPDSKVVISAGGNKAILRLADGSEISLSELQSEIIVGDALTYADGSVVKGGTASHWKDQKIDVYIPRGGTYKIILADGTRVWLNADTRLKYQFNKQKQVRELELDGEAYFEVAHQNIGEGEQRKAVPFLVRTAGYTVKVHGTSFNVTAYRGEPSRTTLVEGSVEVDVPNKQEQHFLKPNQQAIVSSNRVAIIDVESSSYTSWKEGTFNFSGEDLEGILRQAARWYDVEVHFQRDELKQLKFEGIVPRYEDLEGLLKALEKAGDIKFEIKERELLVK
ncbi:FecR family protein [Sphingobacterium sp. WOUb80]|uniref:FecR family protein n=1 Tax=Sphingobacterium sp. WOUb80 TaxID=3234028 RepID=UPI003CF1459D